MQLHKDESLMALADKGYHIGAELKQCHDDNMITYVAYKEQPSVKHIANEFLAESFLYDKQTDSYTCPAGAVLTSLVHGIIRKAKLVKLVTVLKHTVQMPVKHVP